MHSKRFRYLVPFSAAVVATLGAYYAIAPTHLALGDPLIGAGAALGLGAFGTTASHAGQKTKFFRIAMEGATTDGRVIEREWIEQMAANYDPKTYGARINLEHVRGIDPEGLFKAYGDVLALETREEEGGKLGLYAQLKPTDALLAMNQKGQKLYTSCEVNPAFADTGEAYLVGLAVTDNPASLGTEMLAFAAKTPAIFKAKKQDPDNLFTEATEAHFELEPAGAGVTFLSKIKGMLKGSQKDSDQRFADVSQAVEAVADHARQTDEKADATAAKLAKLEKEFTALNEKLQTTPTQEPRPFSKGGGSAGKIKTDC